ncbi:MAG: hypothetical protein KDN05_01935 [Verrucomicrobiae bacterium]|nr:hypothetical protein [Verrucomicrobiae bacterium]
MTKEMHLIAFHTDSHHALAGRFAASLKDPDISLEMVHLPTSGSGGGSFRSESWRNAVVMKIQKVTEWIKNHPDEILVCSDVDIQFFRPIRPVIEGLFQDRNLDIAFQAEHSGRSRPYNAGFIAMRCGLRSLALYEAMRDADISSHVLVDQDWINGNIDKFPIRHSHLPHSFWAWSHGSGTLTKDIVLHHANCTVGKDSLVEKVVQLDHVRDIVLNGG